MSCHKMTFTRAACREIDTRYTIINAILQTTDSVKDLGIILDKKLNYDYHITQTITKSKRAMGFVLRNTKFPKDVTTLKILYCALVMEFGALVWNPVLKKHSDALEKVQRWFLRWAYFKVFQYYPTYEELLRGFELESLENRRRMSKMNLLHEILQGNTNGTLLQGIRLRIPRQNSRLKETFYTQHTSN